MYKSYSFYSPDKHLTNTSQIQRVPEGLIPTVKAAEKTG